MCVFRVVLSVVSEWRAVCVFSNIMFQFGGLESPQSSMWVGSCVCV